MVPLTELEAAIEDALDVARQNEPSRENSLVITKLEEALMWATKVRPNAIDS